MENNQIIELNSLDSKSNYKKESLFNNFENVIPILVLILIFAGGTGKEKTNKPYKSIPSSNSGNTRKSDYEALQKSEHMVEKLSNAVELMRKINKLNEIKNITSKGQGNLDGIQEAFSIFRNIFSDNTNIEKLETLENTISTVKKFGEIKKLMDFQKSFNEVKESDNSVTNMMGALTPLLSGEDGDNMKNLQKILKMANLISTINSKE